MGGAAGHAAQTDSDVSRALPGHFVPASRGHADHLQLLFFRSIEGSLRQVKNPGWLQSYTLRPHV